MFSKEDLDSWNELFPDCAISESDLERPTETFLTKTLVSYLRMFGYDVQPPFPLNADSIENTRENRLFLIKVVRHIDHILKITDKSYTFYYYDLLKPTPRKTANMLGILLNYLYYFNLYKTDVYKMTDELISKRQELLKRIISAKQENALLSKKAGQIKESIAHLTVQVPQAKDELSNLNARKNAQDLNLEALEKTVNKLAVKLEKLRAEKRDLEKQLIPEIEAVELRTQFQKHQEKVAENNVLERIKENELREAKKEVETVEKLIHDIDKAVKLIPENAIDAYVEANKRLEEARAQLQVVELNRDNLEVKIEEQNRELEALKEYRNTAVAQYEKTKTEELCELADKQQQYASFMRELQHIEEEEHELECKLEEQKAKNEYVEDVVKEIMFRYL